MKASSKHHAPTSSIMEQISIPMHHLHSSSSEHGSQGPLLESPTDSAADHVCIDVTLNEIEANGLKEIEGDLRLKLILKDWQSKLKESQERKERKQSLSLNVKNEIYQLVGFFILFQGVVLTTVSQATQLTCHNWWGPFALSLLASLTTLVGVCNKFHNFIKWKRASAHEIELSKVLKGQISRLKKFGAKFNFSEHAPEAKPRKQTGSQPQSCRYYILAVLVIVSMLGFAVIMLISCQRILCDQGTSPNPS